MLQGAVNRNWRARVDGWLRRVEFALLPPHCLLCGGRGSAGRDLCAACAGDLAHNQPCCARCALPLPRNEPLCGMCLRREPPFASAWAPYRYAYPLDQLLTHFKFGRDLAAGHVLQQLWVDAARAIPPPRPDALLSVPLHPARLRERGYNQALELARPLAQRFDLPLRHDLLLRQRPTEAQSGLDLKARVRNVRAAFTVSPDATLPSHIALIDDVMTTGATLRECARVLRQAGVARVDVWALARAPQRRG